jgi:hypothetical protein
MVVKGSILKMETFPNAPTDQHIKIIIALKVDIVINFSLSMSHKLRIKVAIIPIRRY